MPPVRGYQVIAGVAPEVAYGTEVLVTDKLRYVSSSLDKTFEQIQNEALLGAASQGPGDQGLAMMSGDLVVDLDYGLANILLERFFGNLTAGVYSLEDTVDDLGFTLAMAMRVSPWVFTGCKVGKLELSGAPGEPIRATFSLFAAERVLTTILNDQAALDALSTPAAPRVLFHHCANGFWVGDQANILTVADALKINSWTLSIDRAMEQYHTNAQSPEQARENGFMTVELSVGLPLYESNVFVDAHANYTPLQCRTTFTRGAASKTFRLPNLFVTSATASASGPGLIPHEITLSCTNDLANANASADMTFPEPVQLTEA